MDVSYSVFPDGRAGPEVVTHELAESISDPGRSPGWGEICDPCENTANETVPFRGVSVATIHSPLQNKCVGPVDDGHGVLGMDIHVHMSGTKDCAGFIVEGSKLSFSVSASRNGLPVAISKVEWLYQFPPGPYQSFVGPVLSLIAPLGGIKISVTVTDAADGCYAWSKEAHVGVISLDDAAKHSLICKLQQELANYDPWWRLRPNPWNPSRDFLSNPVTLEEIDVTRKFAQYLLQWTEVLENVPGIPQRISPSGAGRPVLEEKK
jgi:hypothetical protein